MTCQRGSHILTPGVYACSTVIPTVTNPSRVQGDWEEPQSSVMQTVPVTDSAQSGWNSFCTLNIPATSQVAHEPIENTSEAGPTLLNFRLFLKQLRIPASGESWCCSSTESDHAWELLPGSTGQTQAAKSWLQ